MTALHEKQEVDKSEAVLQGRHWTAEDFYRAAASGAFEDPDRLELIHGRLIRLMQGERHANLRVRVSRRLQRALSPPFFVRDENPLHIAFDGEPVPDLMLNYQEEYEGRHPEPEDVALLVEVADSTVDYDTGEESPALCPSGNCRLLGRSRRIAGDCCPPGADAGGLQSSDAIGWNKHAFASGRAGGCLDSGHSAGKEGLTYGNRIGTAASSGKTKE